MAELITAEERAALIANGRRALEDPSHDPVPVVRIVAPDGPQSWLLTEIDPAAPDVAYGLCDLGQGCPEPGPVGLAWLAEWRGPLGMTLERDGAFKPPAAATLSFLTRVAAAAGRIVL